MTEEKEENEPRSNYKRYATIAFFLLLIGIAATEEARHILCAKAEVCVGVRPVFLGHGGFPTPDD